MTQVIDINDGGMLTLPPELRDRLGLQKAGQVVAEETAEGVLLRPSVTPPVEIYSKQRLAEFERGDAELAPHVEEMRAALVKARAARKE